MLHPQSSPGGRRSTKKKSFFDTSSTIESESFFDLDTESAQNTKAKVKEKKEKHLEFSISFSNMQLEDDAIINRLDSLLEYSDAPKDTPLRLSLKNQQPSSRTGYYKDIMLDSYKVLISKTKKYYEGILNQKITSASPAYEIVQTITKVFVSDRNIMLNLCNVETEDDLLYQHVVKTTIYAVNIATALGYSKEDINEIGVGALMSDVGMAAIAKRIRNFKGKYSSNELYLVRKHPIFSANILDTLPEFPATTSLIAYQAHERSNGLGYPRKRKGNILHRFSKIVSIADVYTALSSNRCHRKAHRPFEAIKKIISMTDKGWFDKESVNALLEYTSLFPIGSIVQLNNNSYAKVISASKNSISTPIISIFTDKNGFRLSPNNFVITDLSVNTTIRIVGTKENQFLSTSIMAGF